MFESFDADALLTEVESSRLDESAVWARRMAAIASLLAQRTGEAFDQEINKPDADPGFALISGFVRTVGEVGPALGVAPAVATKIVGYAEALDERLPHIYGLLASGRLDWESTTVILNRTQNVLGDTAIADLDRNLAAKIARWDCWSRTRLVSVIDRAILNVDPEGAKERRACADTQRRVSVKSLRNGMGEIRIYASAPVVAKVEARLTQMSVTVCRNDPRTPEQRRVDAVDAIADGSFHLACACGLEDCPAPSPHTITTAAPAQVVINVIAPAATVTGDGEDPGFLQGYGVVDADQVRELADHPGTVLRDVHNPDTHPSTPTLTREGTSILLRHSWSAAMDRWLRARALTCSFPYCNRPAWGADIDHSIAFDHHNPLRGGWTMAANLDPKCRTHHRWKTFLTGDCGWDTKQLADGTIEWTSPTGRTYRSTPDGSELFDDIAAASAPKPWTRPRDPKAEKAKRIAAARAGLAAKQAANDQTRWLNQGRADEIEHRKRRNHVRFYRLILSPHRRTASWCPWINDPWEDETITADWKPPPPPPPQSDDDEPPF
ncbi:hypothetical protein BVC93_27975 [Mycobacterium sp. MS1601]|uniref:HNH endonuclease signature motif containing protein n=1 Tax=Mycobacterium sp. MS1601 TaxID=1936029 RepID=UPI0009791350|nr:HNH endonuclease signature motif containing protein [Mycobacterium sp. MS1601]AQA05577.1 hypothetical protein BVC93_27975 [Mycobacterium sp. MS1601]